jgi:hypothetical protein
MGKRRIRNQGAEEAQSWNCEKIRDSGALRLKLADKGMDISDQISAGAARILLEGSSKSAHLEAKPRGTPLAAEREVLR